ncbi:MAG: hypothetical protein JWQ55_5204, partial [Rhodopila sp.]|nr:hypothetical protein [Rhodopila sp.]
PLFQRVIRQGAIRVEMAGGRVLTVNVHRQPRARPGRAMSRCQLARELAPRLASRVRGCDR